MKKNKYNCMDTEKPIREINGPTPGTGCLQSPAFDRVKQQIGPNTIPLKYNEPDPPKLKSNPVRNAMGTAQKQASKISGTKANWKKNSYTSAGRKNTVNVKGMP